MVLWIVCYNLLSQLHCVLQCTGCSAPCNGRFKCFGVTHESVQLHCTLHPTPCARCSTCFKRIGARHKLSQLQCFASYTACSAYCGGRFICFGVTHASSESHVLCILSVAPRTLVRVSVRSSVEQYFVVLPSAEQL